MKTFLFYRPEIVAFFSWALVMIFEILGARIVGPYIGTSLFVWTSLIAIILFALSLGNYFWGKLADKRADLEIVSLIFLLSAVSIFLLIIFQNEVLTYISEHYSDIRVSSIILALILFSPTSFFLWLIGPIVTKIRMTDLDSWGRVVGKISSISTIGSIIWTLGAGFFLIPHFWVSTLTILLWMSSVLLWVLCGNKKYIFLQIFIFCAFIICYLWKLTISHAYEEQWRYTFDSAYSHITIANRLNEPVRDLYVDNVTHAGMYLNSNELAYEYTKYYHLFDILNKNTQDILMLWGAAYSFPKSFLETYPNKNIDVVEIDEKMTELATRFFRLQDNPRLTSYHQDARVFLNNTDNKYDAILGDAFGSFYSIPYQLTTLEVVKKKYDILSKNGVVLLNIIWSLEWENASFLKAEYLTYTQVFPEVFIVPVYTLSPTETQNIMLIAMKNPDNYPDKVENKDYEKYLAKKIYPKVSPTNQILTDDFAPVDSMISGMSRDSDL